MNIREQTHGTDTKKRKYFQFIMERWGKHTFPLDPVHSRKCERKLYVKGKQQQERCDGTLVTIILSTPSAVRSWNEMLEKSMEKFPHRRWKLFKFFSKSGADANGPQSTDTYAKNSIHYALIYIFGWDGQGKRDNVVNFIRFLCTHMSFRTFSAPHIASPLMIIICRINPLCFVSANTTSRSTTTSFKAKHYVQAFFF